MAGYGQVVEECGALVSAGLMDRRAAIELIFIAADGGLTFRGAEDTLDRWQTLRAQVGDLRMQAELGIARCKSAL